MHFSDYLAAVGHICVMPGQCASDYMQWFFMISHPFMTPAQSVDPARHPPMTQDDTYVEPHIPEVPVAPTAAPAHASSGVEQPRHVVVNNVALMFYQMSFSSLIVILYGLFSMS